MLESKIDRIPATRRQERWFRLAIDGMPLERFNILKRVSWHDELNLVMLHESLLFLIQEQDALRTKFVFAEGKLYQEVLSVPKLFEIIIEDARHLHPKNYESHLQERCEYYNNQTISFESYPLWKLVVIQFNTDHYEILILTSHLVMDVYSIALMVKQLFTHYCAIKQGHEPVKPQLEMTFSEYVIDQEKKYQSNEYRATLEYWQNKLSSSQKAIYLDNKLIADPSVGYIPVMSGFVIDSKQYRKIKEISSHHSCTDTSFLLTLFRIMLLHCTNNPKVWLDVVHGLRSAYNENLIGWTASTFPHVTTLSEHDTFIEAMKKVQQEFCIVKHHAKLPITDLAYPDNKRFRDEITAIQFNRIADIGRFYEDLKAIRKTELPVLPQFFCYNLTCLVQENNSEFNYSFLYNSQQFSDNLIQNMLGTCQRMLVSILENPMIRMDSFV